MMNSVTGATRVQPHAVQTPVVFGSEAVRVIRVGWFAFEGFGRPFEAWVRVEPIDAYQVVGRALTWKSAMRKGKRYRERKT